MIQNFLFSDHIYLIYFHRMIIFLKNERVIYIQNDNHFKVHFSVNFIITVIRRNFKRFITATRKLSFNRLYLHLIAIIIVLKFNVLHVKLFGLNIFLNFYKCRKYQFHNRILHKSIFWSNYYSKNTLQLYESYLNPS